MTTLEPTTLEPQIARNVDLQSIFTQLNHQREVRRDLIVPAGAMRSEMGLLHLNDGSAPGNGSAVAPGDLMVGGMAERLKVPVAFLREIHQRSARLDSEYTAAYDAVLNARLADAEADNRSFMVRTFVTDDERVPDFGRAILSDRYKAMDNLDVLVSALSGVREAGVPIEITGCDLTERRMQVRVKAPSVRYIATEFLKGYRNPYPSSHTGYGPGEEDVIFAGFVISNSETGGGAFSIVPRFEIQICKNGMRVTSDRLQRVHLGARQAEGEISWSDDTQRAITELVGKQVRDAVTTFLTPEYIEQAIQALEAKGAGTELPEPAEVIEEVSQRQQWTQAEAAEILSCFIKGGVTTAGGVMQAMTAAAQHVPDPDRAAELEDLAVPAMEMAAQLATV